MKCDDCALNPKLRDYAKTSCCAWVWFHVIHGNLTVDDCTIYVPINKSNKEDK